MRQLGKMPAWQRGFVITGMLTCSVTGSAYLLGHEFQLERTLIGNHLVLASHGLSAMLASIALGSILPFHLKAGYQSKRKRFSGFTQLGFLLFLVITGGMLYYGPADLREPTIQLHWLAGLVFFAIFIFHSLVKSRRKSSKALIHQSIDDKKGAPLNAPPSIFHTARLMLACCRSFVSTCARRDS